MKKAEIHWDTIVKLIIALLILLFLIALTFILKNQILEIFNGFMRFLRFGQ